MKTVINTIDLNENIVLYGMAISMRQADMLVETGKENGAPSADLKMASFFANIFKRAFWDTVDDVFPEYKDNLMGLRGSIESGLKIEVFNEKLNCDGCDECEKCDNDIIGIADMLKENNIETADDFVDRLADQIEKKSGGIA